MEPFSVAEIDEMRTAVEASDVQHVRVKREILLRLLTLQCEPPLPAILKSGPKPGKCSNKFVEEYEAKHPDWAVQEVELDGSLYTTQTKNRLYIAGMRYARIKASPGFVRYYAPDEQTLREVLEMIGHKYKGVTE